MPKKLCSFLIILVALLHSSCNNQNVINKKQQEYLAQHNNLSVAIYIAYPPYQFVNNQGNVDGILVDYLKVLEEK